MKYTLIFEVRRGPKIAVASSNSLLKLCKIRTTTFKNGNVRSYIIETDDKDGEFSFRYDWGCLFDYELDDFTKFRHEVESGHYYKSYDYSKRARKRYLEKL